MTNIRQAKGHSVDSVSRDSQKILKYLIKKFPSPMRSYLALKFTTIYLEESYGLRMEIEEERFTRKIIREIIQEELIIKPLK